MDAASSPNLSGLDKLPIAGPLLRKAPKEKVVEPDAGERGVGDRRCHGIARSFRITKPADPGNF